MSPERVWTAPEVLADLGITYRMLDYWSRRLGIPEGEAAPGSGRQRLYTETDLEHLRRVRDELGRHHDAMAEIIAAAPGPTDWRDVARPRGAARPYYGLRRAAG